jgi:hypothetical protein
MKRRVAWTFVVAVGVLGCGGGGATGGGGISAATADSFEGIYQLQTATTNPQACDVEGASNLDSYSQQQFIAIRADVLGTTTLPLVSCTDDAACASTATRVKAGQGWTAMWGWTLSEEVGPDELGGFSAGSGFLSGGACTSRSYTDVAFTRAGDTVRIEIRETALADTPPDGGTCWADATKERAEAAGRPCTSLDVLTASKRGPLP